MQQSGNSLLLIRPSHFGYNIQTASSNSFQQQLNLANANEIACAEFDQVINKLSKEDIPILVVNDISKDQTPDAIFPNNWVSFHENGTIVLYPMEAPNRRKERRMDVIEKVCEWKNIQKPVMLDLTRFEKSGEFLEGTGSVVFDHRHKIGYAALSTRTHSGPLNELLQTIGYKGITFHTNDHSGKPIYHTNVMLSIGEQFAVVCDATIHNATEKNTLLTSLDKSGHELISITGNQMSAFAGNVLIVKNEGGDPYLLLSETALAAFGTPQLKTLERYATLLPMSIPTIEKIGGGSIRCMVAEVLFDNRTQKSGSIIRSPKEKWEWEGYFDLRWKVLRSPWNQPVGSERDDQENTSKHYMAVSGNKIVGVGRLQELSPGTAQLRYMAVDPDFHGKGIGKKLIQTMEIEALKFGWQKIFLQSREKAVPFYQSCGYSVIEKSYLLFDEIQHYSMEKALNSN